MTKHSLFRFGEFYIHFSFIVSSTFQLKEVCLLNGFAVVKAENFFQQKWSYLHDCVWRSPRVTSKEASMILQNKALKKVKRDAIYPSKLTQQRNRPEALPILLQPLFPVQIAHNIEFLNVELDATQTVLPILEYWIVDLSPAAVKSKET